MKPQERNQHSVIAPFQQFGRLTAPLWPVRSFDVWAHRLRSWWTRPIVQDASLAAILTATSLIGVVNELHVDLPEGGNDVASRSLDLLGIGLVVCQTVPLVWRRRTPLLVLSGISAALFLFMSLGYLPSFASIGFLVALYSAAAYCERPASIVAGVGSGVVVLLILLVGKEPVELDTVIFECLIVGAAWSLGDGLRMRRGQVLRLRDRAAQLEHDREVLAERAVAQERRVIARELHDVVAHNVSVIVAQSGAAQRIHGSHPEEALHALEAIERTGRGALVEMRRLTGFLRTADDHSESHTPQPGLGDVPDLVQRVRGAGLPVTLTVEGSVRTPPAGLDLSAFRIVQEALTNILKHAGPASSTVTIRYEERRILLTIDDDGVGTQRRPNDNRLRFGHLGMQERVALFGGWLRTGSSPSGGYRVDACLPLDDDLP